MMKLLLLPAHENFYLSVPAMAASQLRQVDKEEMMKICAVLLSFSFDKGLLKENPFDWNGQLCRNVVIYDRHLTDQGKLYFNDLIYKWLEYAERTHKLDNVKMLEKWYAKMTGNEC